MDEEAEIKALQDDLDRIEANKEAWSNHHDNVVEEKKREVPKFDQDLTLEERAKQYEAFVIERFAEIVNDDEVAASARVSAGNAILDRAAGKAVAKVEVEHKHSEIDDHMEKARLIYKARNKCIDAEYEVVDNQSIN